MFHIHDRQVQADPFAHLPGETAGGIDDMLAGDGAFVGNHRPFTGVFESRIQHLGMPIDLGTPHACTNRHRVGGTGGISMAIGGGINTHLDIIDDQQWVDFKYL